MDAKDSSPRESTNHCVLVVKSVQEMNDGMDESIRRVLVAVNESPEVHLFEC